MRFFVFLFFCLANLSWAQLFSVENSSNIDVVRYFDETKSLHAQFRQFIMRDNGALEESSGEVWILKPNRFFWDYKTPYAQQIVGNEVRVWHYDIDLEQVAVRAREEMIGDVALVLLAGDAKLDTFFAVEKVLPSAVPDLIVNFGDVFYRLRALEESEFGEELYLAFNQGALHAIYSDLSSEALVIELLSLQRNINIDPDLFDFIAPEGVDVIGE